VLFLLFVVSSLIPKVESDSVMTDVIIAGGGAAGVAMAAALAESGYDVLIVEPGLDRAKRLAGELIHPPGVADLSELGLLACLEKSGATSIKGFAVFDNGATTSDSPKSVTCEPYLLPYSTTGAQGKRGLAIEHCVLGEALLSEIANFPRVTVWNDARVTAIDLSHTNAAAVSITHAGGDCRIHSQLLIAADGRNSRLCQMAGIGQKQVHISNMIGYSLTDIPLPQPGFGHVFIGGPAPVLAYNVGGGKTRMMFDLPPETRQDSEIEYIRTYLVALPEPLRSNVAQAIEAQTPLRAANRCIIPETVVKGRLVCAGDAGGCCHPLTATGLSACTRDAMRLKQALRENSGDIPAALQRYAGLRQGPQRTRLAGAEVLYEVFKAQTPEANLMRQGLLTYWRRNARGRAVTIALLSTEEDRTSVLIREYLQVCRYALPPLIRWNGKTRRRPAETRSHAMFGLSRAFLKFLAQTCLQ
jgi:2-polyprenyl-6-methoxyphenol hydroxylase-like FAD-dependent oxidoreductase